MVLIVGSASARQPAEGSPVLSERWSHPPVLSPSPQPSKATTLAVNPRGLVMTPVMAYPSGQPVLEKATVPPSFIRLGVPD